MATKAKPKPKTRAKPGPYTGGGVNPRDVAIKNIAKAGPASAPTPDPGGWRATSQVNRNPEGGSINAQGSVQGPSDKTAVGVGTPGATVDFTSMTDKSYDQNSQVNRDLRAKAVARDNANPLAAAAKAGQVAYGAAQELRRFGPQRPPATDVPSPTPAPGPSGGGIAAISVSASSAGGGTTPPSAKADGRASAQAVHDHFVSAAEPPKSGYTKTKGPSGISSRVG